MSQQYSNDGREPSQLANDDEVSPIDRADAREVSPVPSADARACLWCNAPVGPRARYCGQTHRQTAWRSRRELSLVAALDGPRRVAYADPPYPGLAERYYKGQPGIVAEVDHADLIARLVADYDGWALSTSARALRDILPLCPPEVRVCAWVKPGGVPPSTRGPHNVWEAVIVMPARRERPGVRDASSEASGDAPETLVCHPARGGGDLPGRKPLAFCRWLFQLLGLRAGDELVDLYPGTGIVGRAWAEVSRASAGDASQPGLGDGAAR